MNFTNSQGRQTGKRKFFLFRESDSTEVPVHAGMGSRVPVSGPCLGEDISDLAELSNFYWFLLEGCSLF